jgi:hypothetical protein
MARKTQSSMAVNAKLSSFNLLAIATTGVDSFIEGQPVALDSATGKAAEPTGGDALTADSAVVFLNWVDSSRSDVEFSQGDPYDDTAPTTSIQAGGLSCLVGNGIEVGLPAAAWSGGALPTVGQHIVINDTTKLFKAMAQVVHVQIYGIVHRIEQGKAYFLFHSVPFVGQGVA